MKKPQGRIPLRPFSYCAGVIRFPARFYGVTCFRFCVEHWRGRLGRQGWDLWTGPDGRCIFQSKL